MPPESESAQCRPVSARVVRAVDRALAERYGDKRWTGESDPVAGLIGTILSQNTTAANSSAAFSDLQERFATWDHVADADERDIAAAIWHGGLANQKAARIRHILRQIRAAEGSISLAFLGELGNAEAIEYLTSFDGVGPKTAACVLMFDLGKEVFPVDTHVFRICARLGWLPGKPTPDKAHQVLGEVVPGDVKYQLHINMVQHGRALCRPQKPRCDECPIMKHCDYPES